jgi:L-iditol 2-dehydrogenase
MKALVLEEYNKLVYRDWPKPKIKKDEVLIQVKACGICGSDVHGMDGSTGRRIPPLIMGHEASGIIEEVGSESKNWHIGDRVTFDSTIYPLDDWYTLKGLYNLSENRMVLGVSPKEYKRHGAFAEYVAVPQHIIYKIPDKVTFNQATMVEPAAVAAHAVSLTPISLNDTAVVVGVGMIGLFIIQVLRASGCGKIIAIDLESEKLNLAKQLGTNVGLNANEDVYSKVQQLTENRGADIIFEVVGIAHTINTAISTVRKGGTVTLVGNLSPKVELPLQSVVTRQIRLQGSCAIAGEYPTVLEMIVSGKINVDILTSAAVPLSEGPEWFKRLYNKEKGLMKVILNPDK